MVFHNKLPVLFGSI